MSFESGKMGIAEGTVLVFLPTFTSVFLSVWSVLFDFTSTAAWLGPLISFLYTVIMFMILLFVMKRIPGDLLDVAETLLGTTGARLMALYLIAVFYLDAVVLLRQFAENTLLTALPDMEVSLILSWFALIAAFAVYIGIEPLARAAYVVLPFGFIGGVPILLLLYDRFNIYHLAPWFDNGLPALLKAGALWSGFYLPAFLLPVMASLFQNRATIRTAALLGLGLSAFFRSLTFLMYTGVFGVAVGRENVLPFFAMTRLIYVNRFIQRVESFFIILWVIFGIATIAINLFVAVYLLTRLFHLPSMRPLILPLAIIAGQLAMLPPDIVAVIEWHVKEVWMVSAVGVFAIPVILLLAALIHGKGRFHHAL
jgi:spore germination protein (amino acid permease)